MNDTSNALPPVVSREEWLAARKALLAREREATRLRDAVNAERRRMPMVKVEKEYLFEGPDGKESLLDLFEGRRQLYVHSFMWVDALDTGCPVCTATSDINFTPSMLSQLHRRDVSLAVISRTSLASIERYKAEKGWSFPWYSTGGNDFPYDYQLTVDDERGATEYNYRDREDLTRRGFGETFSELDLPGNLVFLRDGDDVYQTYGAYARGLDHIVPYYNFLDLTPLGRQEDWEETPEGWTTYPFGHFF
ncbi:DUF899 domain-containing protein [Streptomyces jumonjinensis]|uniref:DUF899 domain-containing protein n=1 Tax=Streptomyces jumonjinensis TaxID=1945 RepID=A0A646KQT1_STRJU|nr:DUF899 domain-containing protein [Streptomyces jumonjinensis]MQT04684.1 DUF899 domain-containing protein [Streptomyces jumonjinensis]